MQFHQYGSVTPQNDLPFIWRFVQTFIPPCAAGNWPIRMKERGGEGGGHLINIKILMTEVNIFLIHQVYIVNASKSMNKQGKGFIFVLSTYNSINKYYNILIVSPVYLSSINQ